MKSVNDAFDYNKLLSFVWSVADECLRDKYLKDEYRDIILPMTVIRRFDTIIESNKEKIIKFKEKVEKEVFDVTKALDKSLGLPFYNISNFSLKDLKHETNRQNLKKNFEEYLNGFSENVKEILQKFEFHNQLTKMTDAGILGSVIEKFTSIEFNLSPYDELNEQGEIEFERLIPKVLTDIINDSKELYGQFVNNPTFEENLKDFILREITSRR